MGSSLPTSWMCWLVHLWELLALEAMWTMVMLATQVESEEGAGGLRVAGRDVELQVTTQWPPTILKGQYF